MAIEISERYIRDYELAELDHMHERLKASRQPDPDLDRSPEATAARRERRQAMTGKVERLVGGLPRQRCWPGY